MARLCSLFWFLRIAYHLIKSESEDIAYTSRVIAWQTTRMSDPMTFQVFNILFELTFELSNASLN